MAEEYKITLQQPVVIIDPSGNPIDGTLVKFTWGDGRTAEVKLSDADLASGVGREKILAKIRALQALE